MVTLKKDNQEAIDFVSCFIEKQWQETKYVNIEYDCIDKKAYRKFCLKEQGNVCCYCSRVIDNSNNTQLEHIIPRDRNLNQDTISRYFSFSKVLEDNVVLQSVFTNSREKLRTPPFPHHIAYQNIVASCNGKTTTSSEDFTCCNRNRGNRFIPPFNLMPNSIVYLNDGSLYYIEDELGDIFINQLNLNKDLLRKIRRIWFLFAKSDVKEDELVNATNEDRIIEVITFYLEINRFKSPSDRNVIDSFKTVDNWSTLMKYRYFLNYFRNNNN
jgi:5-methylcytosine-specific restriction endonuclease McrA